MEGLCSNIQVSQIQIYTFETPSQSLYHSLQTLKYRPMHLWPLLARLWTSWYFDSYAVALICSLVFLDRSVIIYNDDINLSSCPVCLLPYWGAYFMIHSVSPSRPERFQSCKNDGTDTKKMQHTSTFYWLHSMLNMLKWTSNKILILYDSLLLCNAHFFLTLLLPWTERTEQWHVKHLARSSESKANCNLDSLL